jgi:triacylglycerol lipase
MPLLLVHGAGFRDFTLGVNYWGRIPRYLRERGYRVYFGGTDSWGAIETNAETLRIRIAEILADSGAEKIHIIAHSRGGLEARYAISALGAAPFVASLTTISTPHHGVKIMDIALKIPAGLYRFAAFFVDLWNRVLGDRKPDFFTSSRELSAIYCEEFNRNNPDLDTVYYQSYASAMRYFFSDPAYMLLYGLIKLTDGKNDGLCPVDSAKWTNFKGIITTAGCFGVSHAGIIDAYRVSYKGVDIPAFYANIIQGLAARPNADWGRN